MTAAAMIAIDDIPAEGLHLDYSASQQVWLRGALQQALHEQFLPDDDAQLSINLFVAGRNVDLIGGLYVRAHATCDRCLREFSLDQQIPLHLILSPASGSPDSGLGADVPVDEDLNFGTYQGRHIDLNGIVCEQVVLAQPMQSLCSPDCRGLCPHCGQNLNDKACGCAVG